MTIHRFQLLIVIWLYTLVNWCCIFMVSTVDLVLTSVIDSVNWISFVINWPEFYGVQLTLQLLRWYSWIAELVTSSDSYDLSLSSDQLTDIDYQKWPYIFSNSHILIVNWLYFLVNWRCLVIVSGVDVVLNSILISVNWKFTVFKWPSSLTNWLLRWYSWIAKLVISSD
jgi:hypothetical protein